jgi:hypothetical protein
MSRWPGPDPGLRFARSAKVISGLELALASMGERHSACGGGRFCTSSYASLSWMAFAALGCLERRQ